MKKGISTTLVIIAILAVIFFWAVGKYNGLVKSEEAVTSQWGQVENAYQRRADLIPNLVATVKGYATHEENTLTEVVEARAKATQTTIDASSLTEDNIAAFQQAQNSLSAALGKLLVVRESYPELKANKNFEELQTQLEGTENRINVERNKFNEVAREYNTKMRQFPTNIVASICGFEKKGYFKADEAAQTAPKVDFGN